MAANSDLEFHAGTRLAAQGFSLRLAFQLLATAACYYLATRIAWATSVPGSRVSLFFPPHAVLVAILLLVPTRQWWAYVLAAAASHFFAKQQVDWPVLHALHIEAFDAAKALLTAGAIRCLIRSPFHLLNLREALVFVLVAVFVVPAVTALWGATLVLTLRPETSYWVDWLNLSISNGVTVIVLVPPILVGARQLHRLRTRGLQTTPRRMLEALCLAAGVVAVGYLAFDRVPAGPDTSPALLYAPVPLLLWAALRFGLGGTSATMLAFTVLAIWGTLQGTGPFLADSPSESARDLQVFLLMAATPLLLLAAAIHHERRSKDALRASEQRMSLAVESAQLVLWEWDVGSDTVWITEQGKAAFGFEPGEPVHFSDLGGRVHPDDRAMRSKAIDQALATGGAYEAEFRILMPDGSVRWIAARGSRAPVVDDAPLHFVGVSMDVTRRKEAAVDAQLQREELAHLSRVATLAALSGSLAHELTQPLTSVLANAQAAQRSMARDPPDLVEVRAILTDIVSEDRRAGEIIDRLRTMLRRTAVVLQPVRVNESLDELLSLAHSDLIGRGVSVANLAKGDVPPAMTDRVQLQQVLLNLIMNACDAMESVPPEDRKLTLTTCVTQNEVRIGVLDRGIGLPDDVESLFQPFHTTKVGGLGMGLSICRTLVTAHGGRLWAERRAERGAAFYVALPLAEEAGA